MMLSKILRVGLFVLLPLVAGVLVYDRFRILKPVFLRFGTEVSLFQNTLPAWLSGSLPSFFWSFSLTSALMFIGGKSEKSGTWRSVSVAAVLSLVFEILQATNYLAGTFDWKDVLFSLIACLLPGFFLKL